MRSMIVFCSLLVATACSGSENSGGGTGGDGGTGSDSGRSDIGNDGGAGSEGGGGDAGADGGGVAQPSYQDGPRLKARTVRTADGAHGFYGWYDAQLDIDCFAGNASDGSSRCVPWGGLGATNRYSDSSCNTLLAVGGCEHGALPKYAGVFGSGCNAGPSYHAVGSRYTGTVYYSSGADCEVTASPSQPNWNYYSMGAETAPASFVSFATPTKSPATARLQMNVSHAGDGATGFSSWHDTQLDVDCLFTATGDGQEHCLPNTIHGYTGYLFADSTCSQTLANASSCYDSVIRYAMSPADRSQATFSEVTGKHRGTVYALNGNQCTAYTGPLSAFDVKPAPLSQFVSGTLTVDGDASGSRIQRKTAVSTDGVRQPRAWYDTELATECTFNTAGDGKLRCMPTLSTVDDNFFADSGCTQHLARDISGPAKFAVYEATATCGVTYYQLGTAHSGTVYFKSGNSCTVYTGAQEMHRVGATIPVTSFAEGLLTTEK
ncbi:hypothetical protein LVJ94_27065 [Pendulispora rubella]|uniref:DUF7481 domain-containing protein n=1 Tax=Pendulispora rubella TaxID=2741070 RepID=A0ABZ2KSL1_9BACT